MQYISLLKETALPNSLRYNFVQLSPAMFSEFESENSLLSMKIFRQAKNLGEGQLPPSLPRRH